MIRKPTTTHKKGKKVAEVEIKDKIERYVKLKLWELGYGLEGEIH